MDQRIIDLFDEFTHTTMPRREFMERLAKLAGGTAAAMALVPLLEGTGAEAAMVPNNDNRIETGTVTYNGASGPIHGYIAMPKGAGKLPAVVVIHENKGLQPHIRDVARRLAVAGFLALAPDALSPLGGTPEDTDKARSMIYQLDGATTIKDYAAAVTFLDDHTNSNGKVGCVGFCWGGGMSNQLAIHADDLDAAVVFYGRSPDTGDVPRVNAKLMMHYAGLDKRINAGVPAYTEALSKAGKDFTMHMYEGANHAFHNDTRPARYDKDAANLAWSRTVDFLKDTLKG